MRHIDYSNCKDLKDFKKETFDKLSESHGYEYVEYMKTMPKYLKECSSYRELGTNQGGSSSVALLENLSYYELIDISFSEFNKMKKIFDDYINNNNLNVTLYEISSLKFNGDYETDFLLVDTVHKYNHVLNELKIFSLLTKKYIMIHDTNNVPEVYCAVKDFLKNDKNWIEEEHYSINAGYTVLKRV